MDTLSLLRWLHVVGATVLLGTGLGIAFFMLMAHRTGDASHIAHTSDTVVFADWLFTATAVVLQPITGALLVHNVGWSWDQGWLVASLALFVLTGALWLPVVWMQMQMRGLAHAAADANRALPIRYFTLFKLWCACGVPAFCAVLAIVWFMVAKPQLTYLDVLTR